MLVRERLFAPVVVVVDVDVVVVGADGVVVARARGPEARKVQEIQISGLVLIRQCIE